MKGKTLLVLVALAVILVAVAVNVSRTGLKSPSQAPDRALFPGMVADDVEKIVVAAPGSTATVARVNDTWVVPNRYGYPADFGKIRDCVMKLSNMKVGQIMKLDDRQKAAMKLIPPTGVQTQNAGTLLCLRGRNDSPIATLLIGDARMRKLGNAMPDFGGFPDGQYVSPDNGKTVFLVDSALTELSADSANWLDRELLNVPASDIREVSITGPDRRDIKLARKKDNSTLEVENLATNEVTVGSKMYNIESALAFLTLDDVAPPDVKADATGLDKAVVFTAVTQKGEVYTVQIGNKQDDADCRYCRLAVALKDAATPVEPKDDGEKAKAEQAAKDRAELEGKIKALNEKLSKWTYLIDPQKIDSMMPVPDTLFEKKKGEKEADSG